MAFTDDDCVPTPAWLETLLAAAASSGGEAIVRGRTLPDPAEAGSRGPFAKTVEINGPSPYYETCNIVYPRSLLERIDGFDESYPSPAGEDSDLGARAVAAGGVPAFAPDALVHHAVSARGPWAALGDALLAADGVRAYKRNPSLRRHLPLRVFYDRSHPLLLLAFAGLLTRRPLLAALLSLPYAWHTDAAPAQSRRPPASRGLLRPVRHAPAGCGGPRRAARPHARSLTSSRSPVPSGAGTRMARDGEAVVAVVERTL